MSIVQSRRIGKMKSAMSEEFMDGFVASREQNGTDWLTWIGQPLLYSGLLFVKYDDVPEDSGPEKN